MSENYQAILNRLLFHKALISETEGGERINRYLAMLNEIDQNLDAVNAEKVARMIRRNSATAQFVQISLRKVSLKEADHLVGVTMTPESLSEVIMRVNLADVEDEKPTEVIPA